MKKIFLSLLAAAFLSFALIPLTYANCEGGHCALKENGGSMPGRCPIVSKLMSKAHFYLENQKELGLKEEQVQAIKAIKLEVKKAEIRNMAEMQVFQLELHSKLSEPKVDAEGLNAMIDSMSAGMASSAKASVASYAKLKAVLTADQTAKVKEIWQKQEAAEHQAQ